MSKSNKPFLFSRAWLLMMFEACERNAFFPIQMAQLHRLIYMANVLSPLYGEIMPESYTTKNMRGPYFPSAQWDLGRIITQGMIDAWDVEVFNDDYGFWLKGKYRISERGQELVASLCENDTAEQTAIFMREFIRTCSNYAPEEIDIITDADPHYSLVEAGHGVDISVTERNSTKKTVEYLYPEDREETSRESIHRYMDYLKEVSRF